MPYIEIDHPLDRLTDKERRTLLDTLELYVVGNRKARVFSNRSFPAPDDKLTWRIRPGASGRAVAVALRVLKKLELHLDPPLPLPTPPVPADWRLWHLKQQGEKYDALAAEGSPAAPMLGGRTLGSRKVSAIRAVKRIELFKRRAPAWWFEIWARPLD